MTISPWRVPPPQFRIRQVSLSNRCVSPRQDHTTQSDPKFQAAKRQLVNNERGLVSTFGIRISSLFLMSKSQLSILRSQARLHRDRRGARNPKHAPTQSDHTNVKCNKEEGANGPR